MRTFTEVDSDYRRVIEASGRQLPSALDVAAEVHIDLAGEDISRAVVLRLKSYLSAQNQVKKALNKAYAAPAADFFVETLLFYLRVVCKSLLPTTSVFSERTTASKRGALRPDISIWRNEKLLAAVECKTQLGWSRSNWLADFEKREIRLRSEAPRAKLFLVVMTGGNWDGFGTDARIGSQFFVLLRKIGPREVTEPLSQHLTHRVEQLISAVIQHVNAGAPTGDV